MSGIAGQLAWNEFHNVKEEVHPKAPPSYMLGCSLVAYGAFIGSFLALFFYSRAQVITEVIVADKILDGYNCDIMSPLSSSDNERASDSSDFSGKNVDFSRLKMKEGECNSLFAEACSLSTTQDFGYTKDSDDDGFLAISIEILTDAEQTQQGLVAIATSADYIMGLANNLYTTEADTLLVTATELGLTEDLTSAWFKSGFLYYESGTSGLRRVPISTANVVDVPNDELVSTFVTGVMKVLSTSRAITFGSNCYNLVNLASAGILDQVCPGGVQMGAVAFDGVDKLAFHMEGTSDVILADWVGTDTITETSTETTDIACDNLVFVSGEVFCGAKQVQGGTAYEDIFGATNSAGICFHSEAMNEDYACFSDSSQDAKFFSCIVPTVDGSGFWSANAASAQPLWTDRVSTGSSFVIAAGFCDAVAVDASVYYDYDDLNNDIDFDADIANDECGLTNSAFYVFRGSSSTNIGHSISYIDANISPNTCADEGDKICALLSDSAPYQCIKEYPTDVLTCMSLAFANSQLFVGVLVLVIAQWMTRMFGENGHDGEKGTEMKGAGK